MGAFVRAVPKDEKSPAIPTDASDPAITILKLEQTLAQKYRVRRVGAFMAFLSLTKDFAEDDARYARMKEIDVLAKATMAPLVEIGLAEATLADGKIPAQVTEWGIGADDSIVFVIYHRFKIVKRWSFKADAPIPEQELQQISDTLDAVVGKKKE